MKYKKQAGIVAAVSLLAVSGASTYQLYPREGDTQPVPNALVEVKEEVKPEVESTPAPGTAVTLQVEASQPEPQPVTTQETAPEAVVAANPYGQGSPLWYAYQRRVEAGKAVGAWGNGDTWHIVAKNNGVAVGTTPQVNATVSVMLGGRGVYLGAVDTVSGNSFTYSRMNSSVIEAASATIDDKSLTYMFIY
jgi:surface antigen